MSAVSLLLCLSCLLAVTVGQDSLACSPQKTLPHPDDCSRYYYCDNTNTPQVFFCSPGLHYNPDTQLCDLPDSSPCPWVPSLGLPSVASVPEDSQPSDLSPLEAQVDEQPSVALLPSIKQFYSPSVPDLEQPSVETVPGDGQPSDSSSPGNEGLVVGQSYSSSLPTTKQFFAPDLTPPSAPSVLDLEQPSVPSLPASEEVEGGQSFIPVFPGRGGPISRQPEVEDRQDNVGDIVYDIKPENTSESFGPFFTALGNFEKTLEEGRQKEEGDGVSGYVDVKRQVPAEDVSVSPSLNSTDEPIIVNVKEEGGVEVVQSEVTTEGSKTEGRCSADSSFFGRKAPTDTEVVPSTSEKTEDSSTSDGNKDPKTESDSSDTEGKPVWPLFPLTKLTVVSDDSDDITLKTLSFPAVKSVQEDTKNLTEEEKPTFNYPTFTVLNLTETSPLENTETARSEPIDEKNEGNGEKAPEKAEEIEEAKGTIIFESHSEEKENEKDVVPEGLPKVVLKETAIL